MTPSGVPLQPNVTSTSHPAGAEVILTPPELVHSVTPIPPSQTSTLPTPAFTPADTMVTPPIPPDPQGYSWQLVISGLDSPIGLANSADSSGRLFVLEQSGRIRVVREGELLSEPFLDIRDRVGSEANEQGLLGLAFHPRYIENGYFYVNYTDRNGDTIIARFQVTGENRDRADPGSEEPLLYIAQPYSNHNGGAVAFGPDGFLYLGLGDGGSANDPQGNGQSTNTHLGKILRIDVDGGYPYSVPPDNPFVNVGGLPEIWAIGLRNPWRFSFDRLTGDLYIGDVGQNAWEEINYLPLGSPSGANFGWNYREGTHPFQGSPPAGLDLIDPVAEYDHSQGCSVTGGVVYRGEMMPEWQGIYLFGDYCTGFVWGLIAAQPGFWQSQKLFEIDGNITSFGEDESGEIYLLDRSGGMYRLNRR